MSDAQGNSTLADTKAALATVAEIVVFLFAAFDGYLKLIAPPASRVGGMYGPAAVGFASFAALLIFLYAKVWMRASPSDPRRVWMAATGVLIILYVGVGFRYQAVIDHHTFLYPIGETTGTREVYGAELTQAGKMLSAAFEADHKRPPLPAELVHGAGGAIGKTLLDMWTSPSVQTAHDAIVRWYVAFVVVLATAIACLLELMLSATTRVIPPAPAETPPHDDPVKAPAEALKSTLTSTQKQELVS